MTHNTGEARDQPGFLFLAGGENERVATLRLITPTGQYKKDVVWFKQNTPLVGIPERMTFS